MPSCLGRAASTSDAKWRTCYKGQLTPEVPDTNSGKVHHPGRNEYRLHKTKVTWNSWSESRI